jgi:hypothetical protein
VRRWDLARAAKVKKVGFWADIGGYFFIFSLGGGARVRGGAGACEGMSVVSGGECERRRFCLAYRVERNVAAGSRISIHVAANADGVRHDGPALWVSGARRQRRGSVFVAALAAMDVSAQPAKGERDDCTSGGRGHIARRDVRDCLSEDGL